jgi:hypothetical protein
MIGSLAGASFRQAAFAKPSDSLTVTALVSLAAFWGFQDAACGPGSFTPVLAVLFFCGEPMINRFQPSGARIEFMRQFMLSLQMANPYWM